MVRLQNYIFAAMEARVLSGRRGTGAWAFRRAVFEQVGGYDPGLPIGTDVDLVFRVRQAGWQIVLGGVSYLHHKDPDTLRAYWRRAYRGARHSGAYRARWYGMQGWLKKGLYVLQFALLTLWPVYGLLALLAHPLFWLLFFSAAGYLVMEDATVFQGWLIGVKKGDLAAFAATPVLLYLRRLAIGCGRIRGFL